MAPCWDADGADRREAPDSFHPHKSSTETEKRDKKKSIFQNESGAQGEAGSYTKVSLSINVPISSGKQAQEKVAI